MDGRPYRGFRNRPYLFGKRNCCTAAGSTGLIR
jgi:hypothetical protein